MKQKYTLENYDQILKEIRNPKIVFDNDFVGFLENCSNESFLIHKVNFIKQNGKVNYTIKKPLHNLHPKIADKDCIACDPITEFDKYIPEIVSQLQISQDNIELRWHTINDTISLYILQEIDIIDLPTEQRFFLYCYHTLKNENNKIKKLDKQTISNIKSRERVEQFIHKKQYALENLANRLIKDINPVNPSDIYQFSSNYDKIDCLKIAYIYLEKLLRFIEKEYNIYLNVNIQIPYRSQLVKEYEITDKLNELKSRLLGSKINDDLLKLVYEPLLKISTINIQEKLTYYDFNYCTDFILILHHQLDFENITEESITNCLFDLNFNSLQFFDCLVVDISKELNEAENNIQKIDILYLELKKYNQKQTRNFTRYNQKVPSIKEQIINWIEEEIEYLTKKIKLEANQFTAISNNEEKIKFLTSLSVAQLCYFFALLLESGIIEHKNHTDIFRFIADNFKTSNTNKISTDSIKSKYYNIETSTKNAVRDKIIALLNLTKI